MIYEKMAAAAKTAAVFSCIQFFTKGKISK